MTADVVTLDEPAVQRYRVAVSGLFLAHPHSGTGRYARHVIQYLAGVPDFQTNVIIDKPDVEGIADQDANSSVARTKYVMAPMPHLRPGSYERKLVWEQAGLNVAARRLRASVLYSPHFSMPLFAGCPTVVSIHDLIPLTEPAYSGSMAARLYFRLVSAAARRADAVVTLSEYAKSEIERLLRIPTERIHVVVPAAESTFDPTPDSTASGRARSRYNLPERYLLYVGGADVRKNIGVLLRAVQLLEGDDTIPPLVVAAGMAKAGQEALFPDWRAQATELQLGARVRFVERIAEEDLAAVYRDAHAFLFPSRAEGFGLTPLEAMACGTPVISSNATSLPEAVGAAGLLIPPDDVEAWAQAISTICKDGQLRERLAIEGLFRAGQFSWETTGARVAGIIRTVASCAS
ncbi:MAG: glycosyl transferase group 1 [Chloroflexi bacterium]|nr:glycosyl transferase group 1 [Chloroflexota bacterium]